MKKYLLLILLFIACSDVFATHIIGGEIYYTYLGAGSAANTSRYRVSMRLFTECDQECDGNTGVACPPTFVLVGIFENVSPFNRTTNITLDRTGQPRLEKTEAGFPPCLQRPFPKVCYVVNTYSAEVTLPNNADGYRMSYQNCCRHGTVNVRSDAPTLSGVPGATYETVMPGTNILPTGNNSNAIMDLKDTALVCHGSSFTLPFSATDIDDDSLSYRFEAAYDGGSFDRNRDDPPGFPLYNSVGYMSGYSGLMPLGNTVTIDPRTGVISGIAPSLSGDYVINVVVTEWRGGKAIAEHRKDFILEVKDCDIPSARLDPLDETCDGFIRRFRNESNNNVTSWYWDFGVTGSNSDTSTSANPTFTYRDTGVYAVKLVVNRGTPCVDSSTYNVWVYPGFFPGLNALAPFCKNTPVQFRDGTTTNYGQVTGWHWDFGTPATNDTSNQKNSTFTYTTAGTYTIRLNAGNTYGCTGFFERTITVNESPTLTVIPKDTTYCALDSVQLSATGSGTFSWTPNSSIIFPNTAGPTVFPTTTTKYYATITDANGCKNVDSVRVNPLNNLTNSITASAINICAEDTITLTGNSNYTTDVRWQWSPSASLSSPTTKITQAFPANGGNTTYTLVTTWGKHCSATATQNITVKALATPEAGAGGYICKGQGSLQLQASGGISYQWTPAAGLSNINISNPVATPSETTMYKVAVGVAGCPKTKTDSVLVLVRELPEANLVDDTLICSIDTLRLNTNTSYSYVWSPNYMINNLTVASPLVSPDVPTTYYTTLTDAFGCIKNDSVVIDVKLFVTIDAGNDTTICRTDTFHIRTVSDALSYRWSPSNFLDRTDVKNPVTSVTDSFITYRVIGNIGKCQSRDSVRIRTVPYPVITINPDTSICFGESARLYASGGSNYTWSPVTFLSTVNSQNTNVVRPASGTIEYTVSVTDNKGCPKPVTATTNVTVRAPVLANTGLNDTTIVIGQTLQMNASGGDSYLWTPSQWLTDPTGPKTFASPENDITYKVTVTQLPENCVGIDSVKIKVYLLPPSFYVPTAFSPNGDGLNETLKPIALGIRSIKYFRIYNRNGNLIFETTRLGQGWDGYYKGTPQDPGNYVWMAQGETWKGEFITSKGNAVLVR